MARVEQGRTFAAAGVAWGLALAVALAGCESGPEQLAYVETLGQDTLAVEQFMRSGDRLEGRVVEREPVTRVGHYTAELDPAGMITRMEVEWTVPPENPDGPPRQHWIVSFEGDSAVVERTTGDNAGEMKVAVAEEALPKVRGAPLSYGILDQAVRRARSSGRSRWEFLLVRAGSPQPTTNYIELEDGTVSFDFFGDPMHAVLDEQGRIQSVSGRETTHKIEARRVQGVAVDSLASEYAARDARGEGIGVASPRDEVQVSAAGANFEVVYSRPAMRGREIWGGLVPAGRVWRTGANAATTFSTDHDVTIGEAELAAGSYTLWSEYEDGGLTLIINEETGQWGTDHDPERDLARVPLEREDLDEPVERFTITITPGDQGATLSLTWDTRRYSAPIAVR